MLVQLSIDITSPYIQYSYLIMYWLLTVATNYTQVQVQFYLLIMLN